MTAVSDDRMDTIKMQPVLLESLPLGKTQMPKYFKARRDKFRKRIFGFGLAELLMALTFIILASVNLSIVHKTYLRYHYIWALSPGIWCSVPLLISGSVGLFIKRDSSLCIYNANMALSILSAVMMLGLFILSVLTGLSSVRSSIVSIQYVLAAGSFVAFVICVVHSAHCCAGICCIEHIIDGEVLFVPSEQSGQQRHMCLQISNGEYTLVPSQPSAKNMPEVVEDASKDACQITQTPVEELQNANQDQPCHESQSTEI